MPAVSKRIFQVAASAGQSFWIALAERSGDSAFARTKILPLAEDFRVLPAHRRAALDAASARRVRAVCGGGKIDRGENQRPNGEI